MLPTLKNVKLIASMKKTFFAFSMPITSAASDTSQDERIHDARQRDGELQLLAQLLGRRIVRVRRITQPEASNRIIQARAARAEHR